MSTDSVESPALEIAKLCYYIVDSLTARLPTLWGKPVKNGSARSYAAFGELTNNFDALRKPVREKDRTPGPFPYYGASGIVDWVDEYIFDGEYLLIAEDGENLRTRNTPIAFIARGKIWVNNHAHIVQANQKADTRFLMYALTQADIGAYLTGSTMPKLTQDNLKRIPVPASPLPEQRAIAHILGTLDDKIELNRKMNTTLDEIARTLFTSWFVNFDPVHAKVEGRQPEGMDAATAALFPDRFVDSELGPIPEGWSIETLRSCLSFTYGRALKAKDRILGEATVMGSNGPVGIHSESLSKGPGIVVGRKGNPGTVTWVDGDFWPIDTTFFVEPLDGKGALQWWYFVLLEQRLYRLQADSAVPGLNRNAAYQCLQVLPTASVMHAFLQVVQPLFSRRYASELESRTLAELRDTLLPELLSGRVQVPVAERMAGVL